MHNWWIAAFESAGIWTRDQAQHVSDNIKRTIHKDMYPEAFGELESILNRGDFGVPNINALETRIKDLEATIEKLTTVQPAKVVEAPIAKAPKSS